ncbi:ParB/RepB/Spo0J family partition protein [Acidithiobacillus sp.]
MKKSLLTGLGLEAVAKPEAEALQAASQATGGLFIPLDDIQPDPDQPRKMSGDTDEDLKLLAESILQHGVLQPITVQSLPNASGKYQIVAGERRWRAAQLALQQDKPCQRKGYDLKRIPVFIRNPESDTDKLEMQMVENLARADMPDTDIGRALQKLLTQTRVSKAELARRLGRSDTWVKSVLAKASPEAEAVAKRIGVDPGLIGAGESLRLISWAKDPEKAAVLDAMAEEIAGGRPYSRALLDDAEDRYEIRRRFPKLSARTDLSLEDLRTWQKMWNSSDPTQRAVADRVLNGASLADAMQAPAVGTAALQPAGGEAPALGEQADEDEMDYLVDDEQAAKSATPPPPAHADFDEFEIGDAEAEDAAIARKVVSGAPLQAALPPEERRAMDTAGLSMESGRGLAPVAEDVEPDLTVRIPGDTVRRLLRKAGIPDDLTVDPATLLTAINSLLA